MLTYTGFKLDDKLGGNLSYMVIIRRIFGLRLQWLGNHLYKAYL